ncbi:MAG TPA: RnfABCDGE type electron transport complex subunit B [Oceanipulchritudo sp.]|nr:RnfABCDGE type electron transport complex subunit B [Oceanipulchritudo sp.]
MNESIPYIVSTLIFMGVLGFILAAVLAFANRKLHVQEDPRIDEVEQMLPNTNCGACGSPGCRAFAEACVSGEANPAQCTVSPREMTEFIASYLGVEVGDEEKQVARLACAGGNHVARMRAAYAGMDSCRAAVAAGGGGKACSWGCLGLGDCDESCDFDAIHMDKHGLPVVDEDKCVACNDCVVACPLNLFELHPVSHKLWVACKSLAEGDEALADCEVACTGCARCAADAPEGLIEIKNNLAVIDYSKNQLATPLAIQRCPTGAIVWQEKGTVRKGLAAKKILRKEPLPIQPDAK